MSDQASALRYVEYATVPGTDPRISRVGLGTGPIGGLNAVGPEIMAPPARAGADIGRMVA